MNEPSSEGVGNIPQASENFGTIPNPSEPFRTVRNISERTETHTLTVREVARLFEQAGVTRTERSIINWCRINRQGVARLDAFFDENEGRYYITQQSVTRAIEEERAKQSASGTAPISETEIPNRPESKAPHLGDSAEEEASRLKLRDLEITNRAKDYFIEELKKERNSFNEDRERYVGQLMSFSRYVGELETELLQLGGAPRGDLNLPHSSEAVGKAVQGTDSQNAELDNGELSDPKCKTWFK